MYYNALPCELVRSLCDINVEIVTMRRINHSALWNVITFSVL
jgi:hypothetical protein